MSGMVFGRRFTQAAMFNESELCMCSYLLELSLQQSFYVLHRPSLIMAAATLLTCLNKQPSQQSTTTSITPTTTTTTTSVPIKNYETLGPLFYLKPQSLITSTTNVNINSTTKNKLWTSQLVAQTGYTVEDLRDC